MKYTTLLLISCYMSLTCFAEYSESKGFIGSIQIISGENKAGEKVETLAFNTHTSGKPFAGVVRVSVELTDKEGNIAWGEGKGYSSVGEVKGGEFGGYSYSGAVRWCFDVPHGKLKRPRVTGYVVEFGYVNGGKFVSLAEECYRVKSQEELVERNHESLPLKVRCASTESTVE